MTEITTGGTELIVAGFGDKQTAFLARAALARLQEELGMATNDVMLVLREADGSIAVQQANNRTAGKNETSIFWEMLTDLLFDFESDPDTNAEVVANKCATLGVESTFISDAENQLRQCASAILVLTRDQAQREKVAGMLKGFFFSSYLGSVQLRREKFISGVEP